MLEIVGLNGSQIALLGLMIIVGIIALVLIGVTIHEVRERDDYSPLAAFAVAAIALTYIMACVGNGVNSNAAYTFEGPATFVGMQETFEEGSVMEVPLVEVPGAKDVSGPQQMVIEDFRVSALEPGEKIDVSCTWFADMWNCQVK